MEVKKAMNHNELRSLQEAYLDVYEGSNVENVEELYKGKHGQSEKEYQDGRSDAGKMISGDSKGSGANYSYKAKNTGPNPAGGSKKPQGQARMGAKDREYLKYRKANLKKEDLDIFDTVLEFLQVEGYAETLEEAEWMMANLIDKEAIDIILGEDAGIVSGLAGLALGAKGASYAAKHTKRLRDYPKNFVKGMVDPRTYGSKKKKEQKEECVNEADSLAAMQARREKRLAAQRKREGTTASGRDFGRDDSLSADQQKKRRDAEFKAGLG